MGKSTLPKEEVSFVDDQTGKIYDLEPTLEELMLSEEKYISKRKSFKKRKAIITAVFFSLSLVMVGVTFAVYYLFEQIVWVYLSSVLAVLFIVIALIFVLVLVFRLIEGDVYLDNIRAKKRIYEKLHKIPNGKKGGADSYFERLVNINVTNLSEYYSQVKAHTNKSFLASLLVGCLGFLLIGLALILGFISSDKMSYIPYISACSGIATEFIGAIFFYLYSKTVHQMKSYHDSLLSVQNVLLSFKIVEGIEDVDKKINIMEKVVTHLIAPGTLP